MKIVIVMLQLVIIAMMGYLNDINDIRQRNLTYQNKQILQLLDKIEFNTSNSYQTEVKIDYLNARLKSCELAHMND